jgi:predicted lipid-binding transport protein (Tim44 family)
VPVNARHTTPLPTDLDEVSAGNVGFETLLAPTDAERREYMHGQRTGLAQGWIGGLLVGSVIGGAVVAFAVWAGVQSALGVL